MNTEILEHKLITEQEKNKKLELTIKALKAQMVHNNHFSFIDIDKASERNILGSAVIISITDLEGSNIIEPTAIKDGLTDRTIKALKLEFIKNYKLQTMLKPTLR